MTALIDQLQQEKHKVFELFKELNEERDKTAELKDQLQFQTDNIAYILSLLRGEMSGDMQEKRDEIQQLKCQLKDVQLKVRAQKEIIRDFELKDGPITILF